MSEKNKPSARYEQGMATRREVLGDDYVNARVSGTNTFNEPFQHLITEAAWGHVWSRENWSKRERSMVTIALLAALGHYDEMVMHIKATPNTGATEDDIREALLHVAIYAGVPAANHAIKLASEALKSMKEA
ncbi:4-carboxymuconolactone decarboxylase [Pelagibacterium limicola]|uniref:4-carboxymuconolactone decarboxylase n=1 Tax=Pelagibacterium limicola TaxID=2791022 RepID=UPI0018AF55CF|nr:4-carboxymuconolactone decarboxylase [Pelagibacterium limicola]